MQSIEPLFDDDYRNMEPDILTSDEINPNKGERLKAKRANTKYLDDVAKAYMKEKQKELIHFEINPFELRPFLDTFKDILTDIEEHLESEDETIRKVFTYNIDLPGEPRFTTIKLIFGAKE